MHFTTDRLERLQRSLTVALNPEWPQLSGSAHASFPLRRCFNRKPLVSATTVSFAECVLSAVNLGGDTDTTGCVLGGLAGVHYGVRAIPKMWLRLWRDMTRLNHLSASLPN